MMRQKTKALARRPDHSLGASIDTRIFMMRGQKIMVDSDLADLYRVATKVFNQAVRRNLNRFPKDFMFRLTAKEMKILRSQIVTSSWGGRRTLPYAFTEQGVAMLSSVLNSERAVQVNIAIMRAFVKLREILTTHRELAEKIAELESKYRQHDDKIQDVFEAIRELLEPPQVSPKRRIGFTG
jgi:ORF6N domain-containing protein